MATMSTSHHSLSILTNSSVKQPINPTTGLSLTIAERSLGGVHLEDDEGFAQPDNDRSNQPQNEWSLGFAKTGQFGRISQQLSNLTDDEFYAKLTELKREQQKTLSVCERLYRAKVASEQPAHIPTQIVTDEVGPLSNGHVSDSVENFFNAGICTRPQPGMHTPTRDHIRDLSSKPPTGKSRQFGVHKTYTPPMKSSAVPLYRQSAFSGSLDEDVWRKVSMQSQSDDSISDRDISFESDFTPERNKPRTRPGSSVASIEDMWENFSIEDYAPRSSGRPSSAVVTKREKKQKISEWRYKLTIPKPFNMTLREAKKERRKTQAMVELDNEKRNKELQEEVECQKKFKARPVPAHIYFPLYDEIMEKQEARRRHVKHYSTERLKAEEKPFKFAKREEEKQNHKRNYSAPQTDFTLKKSTSFKAKPVPKYIFNNSVDEKIQEEELYRKIRMKMRSEELLRSSGLPPNMKARQELKTQKTVGKARTSKKKDEFKPKINHKIPDYDDLYKKFQKELARKKYEKENTVSKPFDLKTSRIPSNRDKILQDIENDEEILTERRWPYRSTSRRPSIGYLSSSLDSIPTKATTASILRTSLNKERIHHLTKKEHEELEADRKRRIKNMKMKKYISDITVGEDSITSARKQKEKLREMRLSENERREAYENELARMKDRVNKRPLLFQQESQINAKKAAERKFSATLRNVGLDEDFIQSRSSRTASLTGGDDTYEDDFEGTNLKTRYDDGSGDEGSLLDD
ncbi:hypothetical protein ScPMuIL_014150 [Solemya velum]